MPRLPRLDIPGLIYHVIFRGIEQKQYSEARLFYKISIRRKKGRTGTETARLKNSSIKWLFTTS